MDLNLTKKLSRVAGAQIPVSSSIEYNKKEILKAIDWAAENEVDHLLTPEASVSGYGYRWDEKFDEIKDAVEEIRQHMKGRNMFLHLGTCYKERELTGILNRNELRHYAGDELFEVTYKSYCIPNDFSVRRTETNPLNFFTIPGYARASSATGLLCNDMWGATEEAGIAITELIKGRGVEIIFHATNGMKLPVKDGRFDAFDKFHDGMLRMTAMKTLSYIVTVDSCTPWLWDPEVDIDKIDACTTSSESGVVDFLGWKTEVPRNGRQYFYHDLDLGISQVERFKKYNDELPDTYPFPLGKPSWQSYHQPI